LTKEFQLLIGAKGKDSSGGVITMLRPPSVVRRLKVAPRKAKPLAEINSVFYERLVGLSPLF